MKRTITEQENYSPEYREEQERYLRSTPMLQAQRGALGNWTWGTWEGSTEQW